MKVSSNIRAYVIPLHRGISAAFSFVLKKKDDECEMEIRESGVSGH